jgi:hypothetical protein
VSDTVIRSAQDLRFREWLALTVVGPLLGWWLMVGRAGIPSKGEWTRDSIRAGLVQDHSFAGLLGGLAMIGVILAVISPRLRGFGAVSIMALVIAFVVNDYLVDGEKHNVIGGEIVFYVMFTGFAVFVSWAFTDILRFARDRRRGGRA